MSAPLEKYESVCMRCGRALKKREIAVDFEGQFYEWDNRNRGKTTFSMCGECWQWFVVTNHEGLMVASVRTNEVISRLWNQDQEDKDRRDSPGCDA